VTRGIEDLFTQLRWLDDDVHGFSSFYSFRNHYCITRPVPGAPPGVVKIVGYQNMDELQRRLDAWSIRMTAADCLDLPPRIPMVRPVEMTKEQKRLYIEMRDELFTQMESGEIVTAEQAVVKLLRLQQILCGHITDEDGRFHWLPTNRPDACLAAAEEASDKVVVWARFQPDVDLLRETFKAWAPAVYDGRETAAAKKEAKRRFINDADCRVFIGNPAAAGVGTDGLQHSSHTMIYYSNSFKAYDRWQSEGRLFRDGQKGTVKVIDLVVPNSIDGYILKTLKLRKDVATAALDVRGEI
jgi:SNF2 family DNA or RNA helicase